MPATRSRQRRASARRWHCSQPDHPTRWCWTWCSRMGRASRYAMRSGDGAGCRSWSSPPWATSARRFARSTPAPTTTSPSRSAPTSCWRGGGPKVEVGDLVIDVADRSVTRGGSDVHLTPIEFDLVRVLATHHGRLVTQRQLLREVWGPQYTNETHYLRVHVAHIRAKLEDDPARPHYLITEPGVGYRLRDTLN